MKVIIRFLFLLLALPSHAQEKTIWLENPDQLSCAPKTVHRSDTISLTLGPDHGRELGIRRHSDHTWYFLIIGSPPEDAKPLMTPEEFEKMRQIDIPASLITTEWTTGEDVPVFSTSGLYTIFMYRLNWNLRPAGICARFNILLAWLRAHSLVLPARELSRIMKLRE